MFNLFNIYAATIFFFAIKKSKITKNIFEKKLLLLTHLWLLLLYYNFYKQKLKIDI